MGATKTFGIELGKSGRKSVSLDARTLLDTRLLITGNSGSGKSWLCRLIAEQTCPRLPTFVLDPEGEYPSLREHTDVVLVSHDGGDLRPTVSAAPAIARKLLDLGVSAVIDIYELKLDERRAFVRRFCDALMGAPRSAWRPCLVLLDEAHRFCPERGGGSSEATEAVITLLAQGRKRGIGTVLATQRLSKLHKDAAAEATNVLVGRTTLDVDLARARDLLGLTKADASQLRRLAPGHWNSLGPAFTNDEVTKFRAAQVKTTHPQAGQRHLLQTASPSKKLRRVLRELSSIEDDATTAYTLEEANAKIAELTSPKPPSPRREPTAKAASRPSLGRGGARRILTVLAQHPEGCDRTQLGLLAKLSSTSGTFSTYLSKLRAAGWIETDNAKILATTAGVEELGDFEKLPSGEALARYWLDWCGGGGKRRILQALVDATSDGLPRNALAETASLSPDSGTFSTYLSKLRSAKLIHGRDRIIAARELWDH